MKRVEGGDCRGGRNRQASDDGVKGKHVGRRDCDDGPSCLPPPAAHGASDIIAILAEPTARRELKRVKIAPERLSMLQTRRVNPKGAAEA